MNNLDTVNSMCVELNGMIIRHWDHGLLSSYFKDRFLNVIQGVYRELEVAEMSSYRSILPSFLDGNSSVSLFPESNVTSFYQESNSDSYSQQSSTSSSDKNVSNQGENESLWLKNCGCRRDDSRCNCHQQANNSDRSRSSPRHILNGRHTFLQSYNAESRDCLTGRLITTILSNMSNDQIHCREQEYDDVEKLEEENDELDYALTEEEESAIFEDASEESCFDETIRSLHSLRLSMRESVADFESERNEMRDALLSKIDDWNITSKKFKGLPVDEKKKEMVKFLFSSNYGVCFTPNNISRASTYEKLVDHVFPELSAAKRKDITEYFVGALKGNKYFKQIGEFILQLHESCEEDDCIADQ